MLASVEHGAKNRLATVFFYLNNVREGLTNTCVCGCCSLRRAHGVFVLSHRD